VLTLTTNEPAVENVCDRQMRFDINCIAEDGELVNVDMSLNPKKFEPVRLEYHAAKLFAGQGIMGFWQNLQRPEARIPNHDTGKRGVFRRREFLP